MIARWILIIMLLLQGVAAWAQPLTAGFTGSPTSGCAPLLVNFTNTTTPAAGTTYSWNFAGFGTSTFTNPSVSFPTVGVHVVTLTATNGTAVSTYTMSFTVQPQPTVNFVADDTAVCPGTPITFTSTTVGGVPGAVTCTWNWGDGSPTTTGSPATHTFPGPGYYSVTLFATNAAGCPSSLIKSAYIHIYTPPNANASWAPFAICNPPGTVTFTNSSTGVGPLTHDWAFGDGGTATTASPSHLYSTFGTFNPRLIVTDARGCKDTAILGPLIVDTVRASFTGPDTICIYGTANFINTSSPHSVRTWNFGDGSPTTSSIHGSHTYVSSGTYTVSLTVTNGPCTQTFTKILRVFNGPVPGYIIAPDEPCPAPVPVTYTGTCPPGTLYSWFAPGPIGTGSPITYTHTSNGIKAVSMVATDPITGCRDTVTRLDTIRNLIFEATADDYDGCNPLTVTFDGTARTTVPFVDLYPSTVASAVWNFADGSPTATGLPITHTFTAVGVYLVTVNVTMANGCTTQDTMTIKVGAPPYVTFVASPRHVCYGDSALITFTPTIVTGPVDEYRWEYGDGGEVVHSTGTTPGTHRYTLPGIFTVTVTPYYRGCPGVPYILDDYITIDSPKAIIKVDYNCIPRTKVKFTSISMGDDSRLWIFGDGDTSSADTVEHTYPAIAAYHVYLATYNERSGCRDTADIWVDLTPPIVRMSASDSTVCMYDTVRFYITHTGYVTPGGFAFYNPTYIPSFGSSGPPSLSIMDTFRVRGLIKAVFYYRDALDCPDSLVMNDFITVGKPTPAFTGSPVAGCNPLPVTFTDASTPAAGTSLASYMWSFGDGSPTTTVTTPSTIHLYTTAGTYGVREIVTDNIGCKDTVFRPAYITVYQPAASFTASNVNPCLNQMITFTNTSTGGVAASSWDFGDGNSSTVMSPNHSYSVAGVYTVRLTVTDANGCTDTEIMTAYVNAANPVANFTVSDSVSVCPPLFVSITNLTIGATTYNWDLGDGGTSAVFAPSNMYTLPGLYNVRLIATNAYGCTDTAYKTVNIYGYAGAFSYTPLSGCAPFAVHFTASLSNVPFITWDFSDGTTSATSFSDTITHIYTTPGAYLPKLLLSDNTGCQSSSLGLDTIKIEKVVAKFGTNPNPVCLNADFSFIDSSTAYWSPVNSWAWSYDGNTSTLASPSYNVGTPGTYTVTLVVSNDWGCTDSTSSVFVVDPPPVITACPDTTVCVSDPAVLTAYGGVSYSWAPPATLSCVDCNPTNATPTVETVYTVTGADIHGCKDTATVTVRLRTHTFSRAWGDTAVCQGVPVPLWDTGGSTYLWLPPTGLSNNTTGNPIATPPYTTIYTAIAQLGSCIPDTNQVTVIVYPTPSVDAGPDQRVLAGTPVQINTTSANVAKWAWNPTETLNCTDCPNPIASMTVTTTYYVDVVSQYGCRNSDSVRILVYCDNSMVFIPNVFTPNGDGNNDVFYPRGQGVQKVKTFRIYNRWGELVFERENFNLNDVDNAWDGSHKGGIPKPDVYVYLIEAVCFTGEDIHIKGDVTIIR